MQIDITPQIRHILLLSALVPVLCFPSPGGARESATEPVSLVASRWSFPVTGGYVSQPESDLTTEGGFSVNRFFFQGGPSYSPSPGRSISLSAGYGFDSYDFSGATALGREKPWDNIHSLRLSVPVRWAVDERWSVIAVPTIRFTGENDAAWNDSLTGGFFAGAYYRFNDFLAIGPGIGVISQLEDAASVFPILLVDWKITDRFTLTTGSGLGATRGPGLTLNWKASEQLNLYIGGRYEKLRFRLEENGPLPDGIGQDSSFPLFIGVAYACTREASLNVIGGMSLGGEVRLEDSSGRLSAEDDYDQAGFFGITFRYRFR